MFYVFSRIRNEHREHRFPEAKQNHLRDPGAAGGRDAFQTAQTGRDGVRVPQVYRHLQSR